MWIIDVPKYKPILSLMVGFNNLVSLSHGIIRVSPPSRVGYAELRVPELNIEVEGIFNLTPLMAMMKSKTCRKIWFSPKAQTAMFREPYVFTKEVPMMDNEEEQDDIDFNKNIPENIMACTLGKGTGIYVDEDKVEYPTIEFNLDPVIFTDMARQLGAPRAILSIAVGKDGTIITNDDGEKTVFKRLKSPQSINFMLSMKTIPMLFQSLMGDKCHCWIVNDRYFMVDVQDLYTFICAGYGGGYSLDDGLTPISVKT